MEYMAIRAFKLAKAQAFPYREQRIGKRDSL
jgi:hypothetical protein